MNLRELPRVTLPTIPNPGEKDQQKVNQQIVNCLQNLFKRDEDKEKRLRARENTRGLSSVVTRDIVLVSQDYTVTDFYNDQVIVSDSALNTVINFPVALGTLKMLIIKNFGAGTITATANGTDTIDENPTQIILPDEGIIFVDYAQGSWLVS